MKKEFKEFYQYSTVQMKKIWDKAIFIFDTNVLLNLYRINKSASDDYIKILKKLKTKNQIWIPYQVAYEYHKNRRKVIINLEKDYEKASSAIQEGISKINDVKGKIKNACDHHPLLDYEELSNKIATSLDSITSEIKKTKAKHPKWRDSDPILRNIEKLFSTFGKKYTDEILKQIYKEGINRYEKKIPPGYNDITKPEPERYGDLILWKQILDFAKEKKKPIILVIDDKKEDWWQIESGETLGPRFELKKELLDFTKVDFHMYNADRFLEKASEHFKEKIEKESVQEIRRMRRLAEERNYILHYNSRDKDNFRHSFVSEFVMRQKKMIHRLMNFTENLKLNEKIVFEIREHQEEIMHFLEIISHESKIHPGMLNELFHLEDRLQSRLLTHFKSGNINKNEAFELFRYFDENIQLYDKLIKYADIDSEYYEHFYRRLRSNQHNLREYIENIDDK